ncbi:MAG TPA: glucokinase, partial [Devosia sp.]
NYAGDMALTFGAAGGIFLAGGLAANILPPVAKTVFGPELSARIGKRLGDVPVNIIKTGADAVIRGAALAMGETVGSTQRRARLAS